MIKFEKFRNGSTILLYGALLFGLFSCSKEFLTEKDPSNLNPESFYTTPEHAEAALAAVYADTRFYGDGAGIFSSNWQLLEAPTGTSTTETAQNSNLNNLYSLVYNGDTEHVKNWWRGLYKIIANANLVLENVPGIEMDEERKVKILGEARFLRAWAYFYAVRLWGDVPLITEPQTATSENFQPTRAPQEEVYSLIVDDLLIAEDSGLEWMDISGRVNLAAVKSLLAKVYLTMAGQPLNKGAEYYKLAAENAKEVIDFADANPGTIGLFETYGQIHDPSLDNTKEHIFQIQYNANVASNPMTNMFPNFKPVTYRGPSGTGSTVPVVEFYESYEEGDIRAKDQEGYFYTSYYTNGSGEPFDLGRPYIFKHFNVTANGTFGQPGTARDNLNVPVIRFAEVLLIYAEAKNELSGPDQTAYDALKRIRDRAGLSTPALGTYNQESFREAVWRERWHELAYEGKTWFDMVRLGKVYNSATNGFDDFVGHINPSSGEVLQERHLLFPIPQPELRNNPNLGPQNPGYSN